MVNYEDPEVARDKILFDNLTPLYPQEKINLEAANDSKITPLGDGSSHPHRQRTTRTDRRCTEDWENDASPGDRP